MGQSYTCLHYHIIFSTGDRKPLITRQFQQRLYDYIGGIIKHEDGQLLAAGGIADHVHLLATLHQQRAVSDIMRVVKSNSSKWIHETFSQQSSFAWQTGYGAFTVSYSNIDQVRRYIERQEEHHRTASFQEEYIAFLKRHGVKYDERYIWT
ncbi:MAG: IS200/IS605 family transposase [Planctomycetota bacterium]|jgi:REP element-mobilizing transposase RayT